jgi:molybdopterin molybdotransferase
VALIANGSELCAPGKPLRPGQIPESNTSVLAALIQRVGAEPVLTDLVPDDRTQLREALKRAAAESDLVITVGGASVGDLDLVRPALMDAGGTLDFWRIAMKPGKPFLCGRLDTTPIYGLPGNPVSAFVTAVVLVLPVLRLLQGSSTGAPPLRWCRWNSAAENPDRRRHFVRVQTDLDGTIRLSGQQGSHRMMSLAASDGLVDLAPGSQVGPGDLSPVIGW